uniref:Testis expressed 12 n=1 Tax=Kryptolebias marmoratus TaxID=37003 RepID=A0A3Q3AXE7_KRYMA
MKDTPPTAGKLIPPALTKPTLSSNNTSNQTTLPEMEGTLSNPEKSPPKKKKIPETATLDSANSFEATAAGASIEIKMLVTKFAEVLSERAAADTFQMKELEGILTEARNLESYLTEKKNHLRQTLALISAKLQS